MVSNIHIYTTIVIFFILLVLYPISDFESGSHGVDKSESFQEGYFDEILVTAIYEDQELSQFVHLN